MVADKVLGIRGYLRNPRLNNAHFSHSSAPFLIS